MATVNETRGAHLRGLREAKPWTQAQLAQASGLSTRTVMRTEAGNDASAETLMALCSALGVDSASLPREASPLIGDGTEASVPVAASGTAQAPGRKAWVSRIPWREAGRCAALVVACVSLISVTRAAVITTGLAGSIPPKEIVERHQAGRVSDILGRVGQAVAKGSAPDGATWQGLAGNREISGYVDFALSCQRRDLVRILLPMYAQCVWDTTGFVVRAAGPDLYEATVGPLGEIALREMTATLPMGSRIRVRIAYGQDRDPAREELLWVEPAGLDPGQGATIPAGAAYAYVRIEPVGVKP